MKKDINFIASNFHDVLRIATGVPIYSLYLKRSEGLKYDLRNQLIALQKQLLDVDKNGYIFAFLQKKDILDCLMEDKLSIDGVIIESL